MGVFSRPLLEISEEGFIYKGLSYSLSDVKEVRIVGGSGYPMQLGVDLHDGKKILVHSSVLELNGKKYKNGFISGTNEAFEKLKEYFCNAPT